MHGCNANEKLPLRCACCAGLRQMRKRASKPLPLSTADEWDRACTVPVLTLHPCSHAAIQSCTPPRTHALLHPLCTQDRAYCTDPAPMQHVVAEGCAESPA